MASIEIDWKKHIDSYQKSGLSKNEYCKQHGVSVRSLSRWQKRLSDHQGMVTQLKEKPSSSFIAIQMEEQKPFASSPLFVLQLGNHLRMEMVSLPSPSWLKTLWQCLEGDC